MPLGTPNWLVLFSTAPTAKTLRQQTISRSSPTDVPLIRNLTRSLTAPSLVHSRSLLGSFPVTSPIGDTKSVVVDDPQNLDPVPFTSYSQSIFATVQINTYNSPPDPALAATIAPFLRAADMCIRLTASHPYSSSVWILIYRFWTTPNDSRRRLLFELPLRTT